MMLKQDPAAEMLLLRSQGSRGEKQHHHNTINNNNHHHHNNSNTARMIMKQRMNNSGSLSSLSSLGSSLGSRLGNSRSHSSLHHSRGNQRQQQQQLPQGTSRRQLHTSQGGRNRGGQPSLRRGRNNTSRSSTAIGMSRQEATRSQETNTTTNPRNGNNMREFIPIVGSSSLTALRRVARLPPSQQHQRRAMTSSGKRRTSKTKKDQFVADLLASSLKKKDRDVNGMCRGRPKGVAVALNSKLTGKAIRQQVVNIHKLRPKSPVEAHTLPGVALSRSR